MLSHNTEPAQSHAQDIFIVCYICIYHVSSMQRDSSVDYMINFVNIAQGGRDMVKYHPCVD